MTVILVLATGLVTGAALRHPPTAAAVLCPGVGHGAPVTTAAGDPTVAPGTVPARLRAEPGRLRLLPLFHEWAGDCGLPASLVEAICFWESGWRQSAVSPTGAVGVCQIEPGAAETVRRLTGDASLDPRSASDNIEISAVYLRWLLDQNGGRRGEALAGYYQGPTSVKEHGILTVSRPYVAGILALLQRYRWA